MKCPICFVGIHESWQVYNFIISSENINYEFSRMTCPECKNDLFKFFIRQNRNVITEGFLIPRTQKRKALPEYIDKKYVKLYEESASILSLSPRASAALSRTCLQLLLREYGKVEHGKLFDEIQQVINSKNIPSDLEQHIDIIRQNGNNAAHPNKNENPGEIVTVDQDEAEWGLDILDSLFDHYIIRPYMQKEKFDKYNKKHKK